MKKFLVGILALLGTLSLFSLFGCANSLPELNAPHEHNYVETTVSPACTTSGYVVHKCVCGEVYITDVISELGHDFVDGVCSRCGIVDEHYIPLVEEHVHDYAETVVEPTCTEQGYTVYVCSCGDEYIDDETDALGHDYDNKVLVSPTCLNIGYKAYFCSRCDSNYYEELPKIEHDFIIQEESLTELEEDKISFESVCSECGFTATFEAEKVETVLPTCMEKGYDRYEYFYFSNNDEKIVKELKLNFTESTHKHLVGYLEDGRPLELYACGTEEYYIDEDIQYYIDAGIILFNAGIEPTESGENVLIIFECEHCHNKIVSACIKPE